MLRRTFKGIILLILVLLVSPIFVFAVVSQLSFTTEPKTVKPGEISGTITIQLQDVSGSSNPSTETVDVEFLSNSPSGEFLSPTSESPVTKTISTGSANKNFRYRDSIEGIFTITINTKGRASGLVWSATQSITISNATSATTSTATTTSTSEVATSTTQTSSNNSIVPRTGYSYVVYYSSVPLSTFKEDKTIEISAGRDRLGTVGSPLEFKAQSDASYLKNTNFKWNFGDGSQGMGETVVHTYEYPGEYVVMLNSSSPDGQAVARANVRVIKPDVAIVSADNRRVEIRNNSTQEISLFGRVLWSGGNIFVFPQDTIMKAGQTIAFSSKITGLQPNNVHDANLLIVGETQHSQLMAKIEEQKSEMMAYLENEILLLQEQMAMISPTNNIVLVPRNKPVTQELPSEYATTTETSQDGETQTATAEEGWLEVLKRFFLITQQ